jgi:hypothetical protein
VKRGKEDSKIAMLLLPHFLKRPSFDQQTHSTAVADLVAVSTLKGMALFAIE